MPALLLLSLLGATPADRLAAARAAERAGDPYGERAACEALLQEAPGAPEAAACRARLAWLAARADAGADLDALAEALAAARDPEGGVARARALLERGGLAPALAVDLRLRLADAALRAGDPAEALAHAEAARALDAAHPGVRRLRARALAGLGRWDEARAEEAGGARQSARPAEGVQLGRRLQRDAALARAAGVFAPGYLLLALPLAWRGWRRAPGARPWGLLPLSVACLGCAALAAPWSAAAALGLLACWPVFGGLHVVTALAGVALGEGLPRVALGLGAGLATLSAGLLVLRGLGGWP